MRSFKVTFAAVFALTLLTLQAPVAQAGTCSDWLDGVTHYVHEMRATKGARLFIKDQAPSHERLLGFVTEDHRQPKPWRAWATLLPVRKSLGRWLTGDPSTRFTPLLGVQNVLVDKPVDSVIHRLAGPRKQGTFLTKFPVLVAWVLLAHTYVIDPVTDFTFDYRVQSQIETHQKTFDRLIQSDFRFELIREQLARHEIDNAEAERQAYMISEAYTNYYSYRDYYRGKFSLADNMKLLDHYLFESLRPVMEGEVEVPSDFHRLDGFEPHLDDARKQALFQLTHQLYFQYQIIETYTQGQTRPTDLAVLLAQLDHDEFTVKLKALRQARQITADQFHHALQERAFWNYRLKCYQTLRIERVNPATGQAVSLADFEAEILADFGST